MTSARTDALHFSPAVPVVANGAGERNLLAGILQHMAGGGSTGINGLPKPYPTEYEENGRLYSTFRRYITISPWD